MIFIVSGIGQEKLLMKNATIMPEETTIRRFYNKNQIKNYIIWLNNNWTIINNDIKKKFL